MRQERHVRGLDYRWMWCKLENYSEDIMRQLEDKELSATCPADWMGIQIQKQVCADFLSKMDSLYRQELEDIKA